MNATANPIAEYLDHVRQQERAREEFNAACKSLIDKILDEHPLDLDLELWIGPQIERVRQAGRNPQHVFDSSSFNPAAARTQISSESEEEHAKPLRIPVVDLDQIGRRMALRKAQAAQD